MSSLRTMRFLHGEAIQNATNRYIPFGFIQHKKRGLRNDKVMQKS